MGNNANNWLHFAGHISSDCLTVSKIDKKIFEKKRQN